MSRSISSTESFEDVIQPRLSATDYHNSHNFQKVLDFFLQNISATSSSSSNFHEKEKHSSTNDDMDEQEPASHYHFGGYHPVCAGDRMKNGKYFIIRKIGWNELSTEWLARDIIQQKYVCIRIYKSSAPHAAQANSLIKNIDRLQTQQCDRIIQLFDHFKINGINGTHVCLVTDVMGECLSNYMLRHQFEPIPLDITKAIVRQILEGLYFLHTKHNLVHTSIKPESIMFKADEDHKVLLAYEAYYGMKELNLSLACKCNLPARLKHIEIQQAFKFSQIRTEWLNLDNDLVAILDKRDNEDIRETAGSENFISKFLMKSFQDKFAKEEETVRHSELKAETINSNIESDQEINFNIQVGSAGDNKMNIGNDSIKTPCFYLNDTSEQSTSSERIDKEFACPVVRSTSIESYLNYLEIGSSSENENASTDIASINSKQKNIDSRESNPNLCDSHSNISREKTFDDDDDFKSGKVTELQNDGEEVNHMNIEKDQLQMEDVKNKNNINRSVEELLKRNSSNERKEETDSKESTEKIERKLENDYRIDESEVIKQASESNRVQKNKSEMLDHESDTNIEKQSIERGLLGGSKVIDEREESNCLVNKSNMNKFTQVTEIGDSYDSETNKEEDVTCGQRHFVTANDFLDCEYKLNNMKQDPEEVTNVNKNETPRLSKDTELKMIHSTSSEEAESIQFREDSNTLSLTTMGSQTEMSEYTTAKPTDNSIEKDVEESSRGAGSSDVCNCTDCCESKSSSRSSCSTSTSTEDSYSEFLLSYCKHYILCKTRSRNTQEHYKVEDIQIVVTDIENIKTPNDIEICTDDIPRQYKPIELVFGKKFDEKFDVWSVACLTFELVTGDFLFNPRESKYYTLDEHHLLKMIQLMGKVPWDLIENEKCIKNIKTMLERDRKYIKNINANDNVDRIFTKTYNMTKSHAKQLTKFLVPMLKLNPNKRSSVEQCLKSEWLLK